ncbi:MAG: SsrA-binding protein SmpB [Patescibacteria group bacterium]
MSDLARNRKATFDYEILDTFEAGLVLTGHEVKAIRNGKLKLEGSHVVVRGGEVFLVGTNIAPYQPANAPKDYDPERTITLLLNHKEVAQLEAKSEQRGLTIAPIRCYNKAGKIKLEIAIVRGKKKQDKRETIKARDVKRDIERTLKNQ